MQRRVRLPAQYRVVSEASVFGTGSIVIFLLCMSMCAPFPVLSLGATSVSSNARMQASTSAPATRELLGCRHRLLHDVRHQKPPCHPVPNKLSLGYFSLSSFWFIHSMLPSYMTVMGRQLFSMRGSFRTFVTLPPRPLGTPQCCLWFLLGLAQWTASEIFRYGGARR